MTDNFLLNYSQEKGVDNRFTRGLEPLFAGFADPEQNSAVNRRFCGPPEPGERIFGKMNKTVQLLARIWKADFQENK